MSCDWNVYCRTCNEEHSFNDANHMEQEMAALVKHAGAIAALAPLFDESQWIEMNLGRHWGTISPRWFAKHLGHDLIPRDEYGRFLDKCPEWVKCGKCGANHHCTLAYGHEGDHSD